MILLLGELGGMGTQRLLAHHEGAGQRERMAWTVGQRLWVAAAMSVVCLLLVPFAPLYFWLMDLQGVHAELGGAYLDASLLGASTMAVHAVIGGSSEETKELEPGDRMGKLLDELSTDVAARAERRDRQYQEAKSG